MNRKYEKSSDIIESERSKFMNKKRNILKRQQEILDIITFEKDFETQLDLQREYSINQHKLEVIQNTIDNTISRYKHITKMVKINEVNY